jgi:ferritin
MLKNELLEALNKQINAEMYSSYLYLSMASWLEAENLTGMASWMKTQAREEWTHSMKFYQFIYERGGRVTLQAIAAPPAKWETPQAVFEEVGRHEQHVTKLIYEILEQAQAAKDHATVAFLQWFVKEQVEEEATAADVLSKVKMVSGSPNGLFLIDRMLGERKGE